MHQRTNVLTSLRLIEHELVGPPLAPASSSASLCDSVPESKTANRKQKTKKTQKNTQKMATLFAIEVTDSMQVKHCVAPGVSASTLELSLQAIHQAAHDQMATPATREHQLGILFYSVSSHNDDNCLEFIKLETPTPASLFKLSQHPVLTPATTTPLSAVFDMAMVQFAFTSGLYQQLILITDNSNPPTSYFGPPATATERALDLAKMGVAIVPVLVSPPETAFHVDTFWNKVLPVPPHPIQLSQLQEVIDIRTAPRPKGSKNTVEIGTFGINVTAYPLFCNHDDMWPTPTIDGATKSDPVHLAQDLRPKPRKHAFKFGLKPESDLEFPLDTAEKATKAWATQNNRLYIPITDTERDNLRYFGPPAITVLGFQPLCNTDIPRGTLSTPYFLRPSEHHPASIRAYRDLYKSMLHQKKVAFVSSIMKLNRGPRTGLLFAEKKIKPKPGTTESAATAYPSGLYLVPLPFNDEIRRMPSDAVFGGQDNDSDIDNDKNDMVEIVEKLTQQSYVPQHHKYPRLEFLKNMVKSTALGSELSEIVDSTKPDYERIDELLSATIHRLAHPPDDMSANSKRPNKIAKTS